MCGTRARAGPVTPGLSAHGKPFAALPHTGPLRNSPPRIPPLRSPTPLPTPPLPSLDSPAGYVMYVRSCLQFQQLSAAALFAQKGAVVAEKHNAQVRAGGRGVRGGTRGRFGGWQGGAAGHALAHGLHSFACNPKDRLAAGWAHAQLRVQRPQVHACSMPPHRSTLRNPDPRTPPLSPSATWASCAPCVPWRWPWARGGAALGTRCWGRRRRRQPRAQRWTWRRRRRRGLAGRWPRSVPARCGR